MPVDPTAPDRPLRGVGPVEAYARFWRRFGVFSGRASRSEYWWSVLATAVVVAVLGVLLAVLLGVGRALRDPSPGAAIVLTSLGAVLAFVLVLFFLAIIVPTIAISIRRLHDADLSGWFSLLTLIPSVGDLILVVLHCLPPSPNGQRFDRGADAAEWTPRVATPAAPAPAAQAPALATFESWPQAPGSGAPATAPMTTVAAEPAPASPRDALRAAWSDVGVVEDLHPKLSAQPSWRKQGYLRVIRPDGIGVLTTQGLSDAEGVAALGPGAEVYLATGEAAGGPLDRADGWELAVVAGVARRVGASGMNLPSELERYGALSMSLPVAGAPAGWSAPDGTVGVILGVDTAGVPTTVFTPQGEVKLVGMAMLHPDELARIVAGGAAARAEIAERLMRVPVVELVSPDRPPV
jgi:uncharacterized membrane protein YhaH (DUF805 family)